MQVPEASHWFYPQMSQMDADGSPEVMVVLYHNVRNRFGTRSTVPARACSARRARFAPVAQ